MVSVIVLSEPVYTPYQRGTPERRPAHASGQMLMARSHLTQFPRTRQHDSSSEYSAERDMREVIFLSRQTLSPSEWQSHHAGIRARSERPTQHENAKTGARLTRIVHSR